MTNIFLTFYSEITIDSREVAKTHGERKILFYSKVMNVNFSNLKSTENMQKEIQITCTELITVHFSAHNVPLDLFIYFFKWKVKSLCSGKKIGEFNTEKCFHRY